MDRAPTNDLAVVEKSDLLQGVNLVLCGGGGIAAIELPRLARELRRHGACIRFVVTENCLRFVGREALEWASAQPLITQPSGFADHILVDDAVVVFPATADLIGKAAHGICSDGVSTLLQSAFGLARPVLFCPTMHHSMTDSPLVKKNRETLARLENVHFLQSRKEEGKEKALPPDVLALEICHKINQYRTFKNMPVPTVAVTYGGTRVMLDSVRCITNLSSGALGSELVTQLYGRGVRVLALEANVTQSAPDLENIEKLDCAEFSALRASLATLNKSQCSGIFHLAAVSDFVPKKSESGKISSSAASLSLEFVRSEKLLSLENLKQIPFQAACKLTATEPEEGLKIAEEFVKKHRLDVLLWNSADQLNKSRSEHQGFLVKSLESGKFLRQPVFGKPEIAKQLAQTFMKSFMEQK